MLDDFDDVRLRDLVLLDRLVERGTITAAARELGVPKPTASRWLAALETRVGSPLVLRGARRAELTERGRAFHQALQPLLAGARTLRATGRSDRPVGTVRVSVPVPLGRLLGGRVIAAFCRLMPGVRLEVQLQNARVDLLRDRIDLAIRGGPLSDSSLIARRLAEVPLWLYAGAGITDPHEAPLIATPGDEALLRDRRPSLLPAAVVIDDRTAVCDALRAGHGVGVLPAFLGEPARADGELTRLESAPLSTIPIHAVLLPEQGRDVRIRALIELIEGELRRLLGTG
jgi:DNA-binding transcriptional LysR family regulator